MKLEPVIWRADNGSFTCYEGSVKDWEEAWGVPFYPLYKLTPKQIELLESHPELTEVEEK